MFDYPVYLLYRAGTDLLVLLPLPFLFAMGQICGAIAWVFLPQYRKLALRNVRIAFGDELSESLLATNFPRQRCAGSCAGIFDGWERICFAA